MGMILDAAELLKDPVGIIGLVVIVVAIYFFVKWVMKDDEEQQ